MSEVRVLRRASPSHSNEGYNRLSLTRAKSVPNCQLIFVLNREFTFGHIEPTSMLGCVMELQLTSDPGCFGGRKSLVERGRGMRIEIIHHQPAPIRLGKINVDQQVHLLCKVLF